jgi:NAD(P)-dependent dehydrogenase (short-subunit alcohol dehydrogenase family)
VTRAQDKAVFITGGASGVGRECARLLVREGARVVIADLDEQGGGTVAAELGGDRACSALDVADEPGPR